ncbi:beta-class carbonic anhydrase [Parenemella sanctibonifatiensis]|uniref:carbonic anhydrase n=1 Tax=Parenemella sanctibonifatiensis TaxID=2016505 RepID=A0A255ENE0_9ACTN|nr:carbonic anhydrase [Parenemella sanctibonifatiensis]OYN86439.1 carbonic anhydrase [Parenemella sanctibonifatiensis]OYN91125.1 carbonic anhydrase [Parenemella sanctibonifatiensis]
MDNAFADLLEANEKYAATFEEGGFDGIARAGVAVITCMDSRIEPLRMLGLNLGDAKILRTPGGRITPDALTGCILGTHVLGVDRILVVPHTRCAMASGDDEAIASKVEAETGVNIHGALLGASTRQRDALHYDVELLRSHPLIGKRAVVGGFMYDVDSGKLNPIE